jgi:hypothetical protein
MKALIFNHHPDYFYYMKTLFESLNIQTDCASEELTFKMGADYCSISKDFKFRVSNDWFDFNYLFPGFTFSISNSIENYDFYHTLNGDVAEKLPHDNKKIIYSTVHRGYAESKNNFNKYKKMSSTELIKNYGGTRITYFVPQRGILKEKKYITQLMSDWWNPIYFEQLKDVSKTIPVIVAGDKTAPHGMVNDWEVLSNTSLLVHHKEVGSCCNAAMKALDTGVPVYITRENRYNQGFDDVPDYCFIFSDDHSLKQAYTISQEKDNKRIQEEFRKVKNLEKAKQEFKQLLGI